MKQNIVMILLMFMTALASAQDIPKNATDISPLLIGEKIPDIVLSDVNGLPVSLSELTSIASQHFLMSIINNKAV